MTMGGSGDSAGDGDHQSTDGAGQPRVPHQIVSKGQPSSDQAPPSIIST
jgi:hypothetical protein